ncbi:PAS and ANTAR domain-containing protein [Phycicoccus sp. BSK3Z-2]|uniref:PAS and ANTAR domain-containing protein n=1 Tax=Phycicoccus avicenniae TaxID=2828860 RepID=A0A941DAC0_9MICO|nr:PAS and ANTAR domain-containing protein [Phycicoccus avicenniae]MBR7744033.1 PAS and ANTAR domain-containing protein [Phycicoccus avicenniae]
MTDDRAATEEGAGQGPAPIFGEGFYEFASRQWTWNADMYRVLGLTDDGTPAERLVFARMAPGDVESVRATLDRVLADPGPFAGQYRVLDDAGRERSIAFVGDLERGPDGAPVLDAGGRPVRLRGMGFDVSVAARVAAAEAVTAATADRAAIEQVKGALMFAYGLDANAAFGVLTRYSQRGNVKLAVVARRAAELLGDQPTPGTEGSLLHVLERALGSVDPDLDGAADAG